MIKFIVPKNTGNEVYSFENHCSNQNLTEIKIGKNLHT